MATVLTPEELKAKLDAIDPKSGKTVRQTRIDAITKMLALPHLPPIRKNILQHRLAWLNSH